VCSSDLVAFCRLTQMGLLRLLTTSAAMDGRPLNMRQAWKIYDAFMTDERLTFATEPAGVEELFRQHAKGSLASPKLWADAYLVAFASEIGGAMVTFDRALAARAGLPPLA
jgi:hypothetical protein